VDEGGEKGKRVDRRRSRAPKKRCLVDEEKRPYISEERGEKRTHVIASLVQKNTKLHFSVGVRENLNHAKEGGKRRSFGRDHSADRRTPGRFRVAKKPLFEEKKNRVSKGI